MLDGVDQWLIDFAALFVVGAVFVLIEIAGIFFMLGIWWLWHLLMRWCWSSTILRVERRAFRNRAHDCQA